MNWAVPPLPHTLLWCVQEFTDLLLNISGLFHISGLLFVEVVKIMRKPRTYKFLLQKFVPKTPVRSAPLWDTVGCAGGTQEVVCVFVQLTCCADGRTMYADRCCVFVWFATAWRFVACCSDPRYTAKYRHCQHSSSCCGTECRGELF